MTKDFFEFFCPVKIISGQLALSNLPHEMEMLQVKKPMIVTDKGIVGAGLLKLVEAAFEGSNCSIGAIFDETPPDSSVALVNKASRIFRETGCDSIVAVGGGSSMDTAKCLNIVVSEGVDDLMEFQGADRVKAPLKPFFAIPTTAGTGSEVTMAAMIYNDKAEEKLAFVSDRIYPNVAVIDPRMTMTMPPKVTAATGMDALTHAIEAFYCLQKNPISDALALAAIKLIMENLLDAVKDGKNENARLAMANGAMIAGVSFSNSVCGCVHSLAHATGGICHVPHGVANNIFLPYGMENNFAKRADVIGELAPVLCGREVSGSGLDRAKAAVQAVRDLSQKLEQICGLPRRLRDAGVPEDKLEAIARLAIDDGSLILNPEEIDVADALEIVKKAF